MLIYLLMTLVMVSVAVFMEFEAEFLHRRVWHGRLWFIHKSHHKPRREGRFETNDILSFVHAPIAIFLIFFAVFSPYGILSAQLDLFEALAFSVGLGMTAFGLGYIMVHDGLVHERLSFGFLGKISYFDEVRKAHWTHHRWKDEGHSFGLFLGPRVLKRRREKAVKD